MNHHPEPIDNEILSKLAGLLTYVSEELGQKLATGYVLLDMDEGLDEEPETSAWAAGRKDTEGSYALIE